MKTIVKKAAIILMAVLTLASLSGCEFINVTTAYGLYSRSMEKIEDAGGYEADCTMSMTFDILGEQSTTEMSMNFKQNGNDAQVTTHLDGEDVISTTVNGAVYVEYAGTNIKYTLPDGYFDSMDDTMSGMDIPQLTEDILGDIEVVQNDDGTKQISINLEGDSMNEILEAMLGDTESMTFENIVYTMTFDENNDLSVMVMECTAVMEILDVEFTGDVRAEYTFINFGTAPEISINYPEDEYIDGGEYVLADESVSGASA